MFPNSKYNEISKKILSINITSFFMHMLFLVLRFKVQVSVSIFSIPIFKTTVNVSPMHQPLEEVILFVLCYGIACMFCIDVTFYLYKLFHNNTHQQSVKQGLFALIFYISRSYSKRHSMEDVQLGSKYAFESCMSFTHNFIETDSNIFPWEII